MTEINNDLATFVSILDADRDAAALNAMRQHRTSKLTMAIVWATALELGVALGTILSTGGAL